MFVILSERQVNHSMSNILSLDFLLGVATLWRAPPPWPRPATGPTCSSAVRRWLSTGAIEAVTWRWRPRASGWLSPVWAGSLDASGPRRSWTSSSKTSASGNSRRETHEILSRRGRAAFDPRVLGAERAPPRHCAALRGPKGQKNSRRRTILVWRCCSVADWSRSHRITGASDEPRPSWMVMQK